MAGLAADQSKQWGSTGYAGRLYHHRRRLGWMRACQPADRRSRHEGIAHRGPRTRPEPADPRPGRLLQDARPPDADLEIPYRARSRHQWTRHRLHEGPGDRRFVLDQWTDLHSWPARGLRPLGTAW